MKIKQSGFTLIELLIVIAIVAILATAAFPQYKNYTNKAQIMADLSTLGAYKVGVAICYNFLGTFDGCDAGENEVPNIAGNIVNVTDGKIKVETSYAGEPAVIQYAGAVQAGINTWTITSSIVDCDNILKGCVVDVALELATNELP